MSNITTKQFCDGLRSEAGKLASGEKEVSVIEQYNIDAWLSEEDVKKINASYIRTIMNRHPGIKEIGSVKVKRFDGGDGDRARFEITLNREPKRKVFTEKDLPAIQDKAVKQAIKQIMIVSPDFSHLEPEGVVVAVDTLKRFKDLVRGMFKLEGE